MNISKPIVEDEVVFSLDKVEVATTGVPDTESSYLVEFKSNSVAPFVTLTKDGLICAINEDVDFPKEQLFTELPVQEKESNVNPKTYLSEEILRAGSSAKQAELIAKQIYRLRESKTNILTGEADNMPPDGEAYKLVMSQIDEQEKALTSMFAGSQSSETIVKDFTITPDVNDIDRRVIFRFSSKLGAVESNDLSGAPVYLTLKGREKKADVTMNEKEQKAWNEKFSKGIIYNVPAKADLKIEFDNKALVQKECDIVQYGTLEVLTPKQLEYKKDAPLKVLFYPYLGAVKQIIQ
ncbi:MAG: DUF4831 family protein [Dysgonomonas sp.]